MQLSANALIAQKRAEIAAKLAAMKPKLAAAATPVSKPPTASTSALPAATVATPAATEELARRVADAKRRVASAQTQLAVKENPYLAQAGKKKAPEPAGPQGVGLKMAAHPLLLDMSAPAPQSKKDKYKPMQPKFASIKVCNASTSCPVTDT